MSKLSYQIALESNHDLLVEPCTYYPTRWQAQDRISWLYLGNPKLGEMVIVEVDRDAPMEVGYGD